MTLSGEEKKKEEEEEKVVVREEVSTSAESGPGTIKIANVMRAQPVGLLQPRSESSNAKVNED